MDDPLLTKIDAHIALDGPNLDPVAVLVPQLSTLKGSILLDFDVQGTAGQPSLDGKGKIDIARLDAAEIGVTLNDSSIDIYGRGDALQIEGALVSTEGKLEIKGDSTLSARSGWPTKLSIKGDDFLAVNLPEARVYLSPDLFIEKTPQELSLAGKTIVPKADIYLKTLPPSARSAHPDVVVIQETDVEQTPQPIPLDMDVTLTLGDEIHFAGFGLDAYIDGELKTTAKPKEALSVAGDIRIDQGTFRAYGQDLSIEQGQISFAGGLPSNPGINLRATRQIDEVIVGVNAIGPIKKPRITLLSTPAMSDNDIISYLLTGRPARELGEKGDKLKIGRQINSKLSVTVGTNLDTGEAEFSTRYRLSRKTHVEATTTPRSSAADIFYTWELD